MCRLRIENPRVKILLPSRAAKEVAQSDINLAADVAFGYSLFQRSFSLRLVIGICLSIQR